MHSKKRTEKNTLDRPIVSKYCPMKLLIIQCTLSLVIMTAYVMFEKKTQKKPDRIVKIEKKVFF
jgi:hypothetical protein